MKQIICGLFVLVLWSPSIVRAITVEEQFRQILQEFVTILELRKSQLEQILVQLDEPKFILATPQNLTSLTVASTARRRSTNNSSRRSNPSPDVVVSTTTPPIISQPYLSSHINTLTFHSEKPYALSKILLRLDDLSDEVTWPDYLFMKAELLPVGYYDIDLTYNSDTQRYESEELSEFLTEGENWSGIFKTLLPTEMQSYLFSYDIELTIDGGLYEATLVNPGLPVIEIITDGISEPEIGYSPGLGVSDVTLWPITVNNLGQGVVYLDNIVFSTLIGTTESPVDLFSEIRMVDSTGQIFIGSFDDTKIVFSDLDIEIEGGSSLVFSLVADFLPRHEEVSLLLKLETADIGARDGFGELYELPEGYFENDLLYLVETGLIFQDSLFVAETQWLDINETVGEFILTFALEAVGQDYYVQSHTALTNNSSESGVEYVINGDYGSGSLIESLTIESDEVSPGIYVIRSGETVNIVLTIGISSSLETNISVELRELWYSTHSDGTTDAKVMQFNPLEYMTEVLSLKPIF